MPMALSVTLALAAIAVGTVGPPLAVYILAGLAVLNETLRFLTLRDVAQRPTQGTEYTIPAPPQRRARGDDGG